MNNKNPYNGICIVHAYYELERSCKSINDNDNINDIDNIDNINNTFGRLNLSSLPSSSLILDFENDNDRNRILRGVGYIREIHGKKYIITLNHIMNKLAYKYKGYVLIENKLESFDLKVYNRISELDIVILVTVNNTIDNNLVPLDFDETIGLKDFYGNTNNSNYIISAEYNPHKPLDIHMFETIDINNDMFLTYDRMKSNFITSIPLISFKVNDMSNLQDLVNKYQINFEKDDSQNIQSMISSKLKGISGSIVGCGDRNIGQNIGQNRGQNVAMVLYVVDNKKTLNIKALPLIFVNMMVDFMFKTMTNNMNGMFFNSKACQIELENNVNKQAFYVTTKSSKYINKTKDFWFTDGDIVVGINGESFNEDHRIYLSEFKVYVPIYTYLMVKSNLYPNDDIIISIIKHQTDDAKIRHINLNGTPYNSMLMGTLVNKRHYEWNGYIFLETSEDMIKYYKANDRPLVGDYVSKLMTFSSNDEKYVIMLNYRKPIKYSKSYLTKEEYLDMPISIIFNDTTCYYFYVVDKIGQKKILNLNDMIQYLESLNQKTYTFTLLDFKNMIKLEKFIL